MAKEMNALDELMTMDDDHHFAVVAQLDKIREQGKKDPGQDGADNADTVWLETAMATIRDLKQELEALQNRYAHLLKQNELLTLQSEKDKWEVAAVRERAKNVMLKKRLADIEDGKPPLTKLSKEEEEQHKNEYSIDFGDDKAE